MNDDDDVFVMTKQKGSNEKMRDVERRSDVKSISYVQTNILRTVHRLLVCIILDQSIHRFSLCSFLSCVTHVMSCHAFNEV